jgi:beta-ketoacyl-acyl-carrier-protein synthase II
MGLISPVGNTVEEAWASVTAGRSGLGPITHFDPSRLETRIAGEVKGFNPDQYIPAKEVRRMDRFTQFALAATAQALEQAALEITDANRDDIGVLIGSGIGGLQTLSEQILVLEHKGPRRVNPFAIPMVVIDLAAGQVSIQYGLQGPNFAVVSACATSAHAIGEGAEIIRRGDAKAMVVGGTEAPITEIGIATFGAMRALSTHNEEPQKASRPFDRERDGFVMGEGGAVLILEDYDWARARGARILGEVIGYGLTADASHVTAPVEGGVGAARAMSNALRKAGLTPAQIGYINAHGTGTPLNEKYETMAIKRALGDVAYDVPVSSTKSMTGHLLGAAGALEAIFCLKALETGCLPPTRNLEHPDPDCDLDNIPNVARSKKIDYAMTNSMGFGGHNVSLILAGAHVVE